jgi:hypothetical protein
VAGRADRFPELNIQDVWRIFFYSKQIGFGPFNVHSSQSNRSGLFEDKLNIYFIGPNEWTSSYKQSQQWPFSSWNCDGVCWSSKFDKKKSEFIKQILLLQSVFLKAMCFVE